MSDVDTFLSSAGRGVKTVVLTRVELLLYVDANLVGGGRIGLHIQDENGIYFASRLARADKVRVKIGGV